MEYNKLNGTYYRWAKGNDVSYGLSEKREGYVFQTSYDTKWWTNAKDHNNKDIISPGYVTDI